MRVAIIADTHFGMHGNSEAYANSLMTAFRNLNEYLRKNRIGTVMVLGDLFDSRFAINSLAEDNARKCLESLEANMIDIHLLCGNHDSYYSNTLSINSLNKYSRIADIIAEPCVALNEFTAIPWICDDNKSKAMQRIKNADTPYCIGHLDIKGAAMNNSRVSEDGCSPSAFGKFRRTISGHFHKTQSIGSISYAGSFVQTSFADASESRGYHILDTDTNELKFIESEGMKHYRIPVNTENFNIKDMDIDMNNSAVELIISDALWSNDKFIRKTEEAVMREGCSYFAGSKKDLTASENISMNLPSMKRDESIMDYMEKYARQTCDNPDNIIKELKRLSAAAHQA